MYFAGGVCDSFGDGGDPSKSPKRCVKGGLKEESHVKVHFDKTNKVGKSLGL